MSSDINDINRSIDNIRKEMLKDFFGGNQDLMNSTIKTSSTDGKSSKTTMTKKPQGGAAPAQGKPVSQSGAAGKQGAANDTGAATSGAAAKADEDKFAKATGPQKKPKQAKPEKTGMDDLNELVGLDAVKKDVKELVNLVKTQKLREERGMKTVPVSLHLVFSGNPGTGKTTVARILAKLYKEIGVLSNGQLVEVDRSGLVAGFVGQTAIKTQDKIQEAMGGILFIDEAYTLNKEGADYGQEAIDTILKAMEDNRKDLVVIVAGYTELMKKFVESNPGLKSRFNKYIEFPDYTADELISIFELNMRKYNYTYSYEAKLAIEKMIREREAHKGENFANARDVRNLFESIITNQATRVAEMKDPSENDITTIMTPDLREL